MSPHSERYLMIKRILAAVLCVAALAVCACGESRDESAGLVLYSVGKKKVQLGEAMLFVSGQRDMLEGTYGSSIWSVDIGDGAFGDYLGDRVRTSIALTYAGEGLAVSRGITLSNDDKTLVSSAADYYYSGLSSSFKSDFDVDRNDVVSAFTAYRLAKIGYNELIDTADIEISRDESRVMTLAQIKVGIKGLEGDALQEKKKRIEAAAALIEAGTDFMTVAADYNEADRIQMTVSRDDLPSSEERVAFSLGFNEVSPVSENSEWLFIFKCLSISDDTLSEARRQQLLSERKEEYYISNLKSYLETNPPVWHDSVWEQVDISSPEPEAKYSFYSVYDMFFPEV